MEHSNCAFPLAVFPNAVQRFVEETAASVCVHPDMVATAFLPVAGALIGRSRVVAAKDDGWFESSNLYVAVVADPGSRKSPTVSRLTKPLRIVEERLEQQYTTDLDDYEKLSPGEKRKTPPPLQPRMIVSDITIEALTDRLRAHPRGVLVWRNELAGWLTSQGQYKNGRGDDRQKWLELWDGTPLRVDRVQRGSFVVHNPHVCLLGTIQPELLPILVNPQGNDGMFDRFLISAAPHIRVEYETPPVTQVVRDAYEAICLGLYDLRAGELGRGPEPKIVRLDFGGKAVAKTRFAEHHDQLDQLRLARSPLVGHWAKVDAHVHRLALILTEVWHVCEETPETVDAENMDRAWQVVDYFKGQAEEIHGADGPLQPREYERANRSVERRLAIWLDSQEGRVRLRDAMNRGPLSRMSRKEAWAVLESAEARGLLRVTEGPRNTTWLDRPTFEAPDVDITPADVARWDMEKEQRGL